MDKPNLTLKQENFCQQYIITGNMSEAYRRAYSCGNMKPETINNNAYKLLQHNEISTRVKELQMELAERNKIEIDEVVSILAKIARFDIAELYDENGDLKNIHEISADARVSLEGYEMETQSANENDEKNLITVKKVKTANRKQALDMLMRYLGGYEKDNSNNQGTTIIWNEERTYDK